MIYKGLVLAKTHYTEIEEKQYLDDLGDLIYVELEKNNSNEYLLYKYTNSENYSIYKYNKNNQWILDDKILEIIAPDILDVNIENKI